MANFILGLFIGAIVGTIIVAVLIMEHDK